MADVFVLSLLHYNLQYCAGGLEGLLEDWPADNDSLEDQIIEESFVPVLGMLEAHPTWTLSLEMQGYMVEVMAARHPDTLARLRTLADAGQVELVSWHWSDQLWTAYPWRDQEVSLALTRAAFEANDLPLSPVVFTQEGQFGEGMLQRMPGAGYDVAVYPKNLAEWTWGAPATASLYTYGDVVVVPGGQGMAGPDGSYSVVWHFQNDGELYATNDMNCYLGPAFVYDPEALAEKEAALLAWEEQGARIVGIEAYVDAVRDRGTTPLPPVVDGTWQPDDTDNVFRWMGGGGLWASTETDNGVLTANVRARHAVAAAETVPGADAALIAEAWREVLLAEVSDATGWNPYTAEVGYALTHAAEAAALAEEAVAGACDGELVLTVGEEAPAETAAEAPLALTTSGRDATATWTSLGDDVLAVTVAWAEGDDPVTVAFGWDGATVDTVPALAEELVSLDAASLPDPVALPLPSGLARLADGVWLVKDTRTVHLAGSFSASAGTLSFTDQTLREPATWRFLVVLGDAARALEVAGATNVSPPVTFACPPPPCEALLPEEECGCASASPAPWAAVLLALAAVRRRHI